MRITHLGHSCILVEAAGQRILVDPGNLSKSWRGLTDLDAILVTHRHPDHVDPEHIGALVDANSGAVVRAEEGACHEIPALDADPVAPGDVLQIGEVRIEDLPYNRTTSPQSSLSQPIADSLSTDGGIVHTWCDSGSCCGYPVPVPQV